MASLLLQEYLVKSNCWRHCRKLARSIHNVHSCQLPSHRQILHQTAFITTTKFRGYSSKTASAGKNDSTLPIVISILSSKSYNTDPQAIIEKLSELGNLDHSTSYSAVFLTTPSLAHLLDHDQFLGLTLKRIFGRIFSSSKQTEFISFAGVVDKLPGPANHSTHNNSQWSEFGSVWEGMTLLLAPESQFSKTESNIVKNRTDEERSVLHFTSQTERTDKSAEVRLRTQRVTVPVANTLFVNGKRVTLFEDRWLANHSEVGADDVVLNHIKRKTLNSIEVVMPKPSSAFSKSFIPLESLTQPRKVVSALGNVIREISFDGKPKPASSELEAAIANFIRGINGVSPREKPDVYALVIPNDLDSQKEDVSSTKEVKAQSEGTNIVHRILGSVWNGACLYRVTGGGGGWGKKQGLLSLDPALDFEDVQPLDFNSQVIDGELESFSTSSNQLIREGSTVEFFATFNVQDQSHENSSIQKTFGSEGELSTSQVQQAIILGTIPTQETPVASPQLLTETNQTDSDLICLPGQFGLLSEGGLAVRLEETPLTNDAVEKNSNNLRVLANSRIDVPFTLIKSVFGKGVE